MVQLLIEHGHTKEAILHEYSFVELPLFYEKILKAQFNNRADFIEDVIAGIGGAFGGYKQIQSLLGQMRKVGE